ncbi:hypothetical protein OUZ56_015197 [Daphnia magna]|uniref:Uncharacterized protein n=1 Tax=Daphnia magna TaxID=35525 RepID=A0ABR0AM42_9CRUS|nr:hypothetical protein OUZ56_015197 [Daphnia magna]
MDDDDLLAGSSMSAVQCRFLGIIESSDPLKETIQSINPSINLNKNSNEVTKRSPDISIKTTIAVTRY